MIQLFKCLVPDLGFLRTYDLPQFRADLQAGVTVAVFAVPQVMAYAILAGIAPAQGLYAVIVASVVAALWGSSPYVSSGPSNSAALLTAVAIAPFAAQGDVMQAVFVFALLVGVIRLLLGLVGASTLVEFVSESAMIGFTVAVGTLIALGQLHHFLGVEMSRHYWFVAKITDTLFQLPQANPGAVIIASGTLGLMVGLNRYSKRFPVALAAIALATVTAELLHSRFPVPRVRDIAEVLPALPVIALHAISWEMIRTMFPFALAASVIGLIEVVTIGRVFATKHGQRVDENREFIGQGIAQIAAACFQGMPCSGSFSRSALMEHTGVRTRMGNVAFGIVVGAAILFFARWFNYIPIASLAGLLLFIGVRLIDVRGVRRVWKTSRPDAAVMAITFVVTVFVHLEYGIFAGIIASLVVFLQRARVLRLYELVPATGPRFREILYDGSDHHAPSDLVALSVHGNLFFALAQLLHRQIEEIVESQQPRFLILRMRRTHSIDYSCWNELLQIADIMEKRGGKFLVCEARPEVAAMFSRGGMDRVLPPAQVFAYDQALYGALRRAAAAAQQGLGPDANLSPEWQAYFSDPSPWLDVTESPE